MYRRALLVVASAALLVACDDRPEIPGSYPQLEDDEARIVFTVDGAAQEAKADSGITFDGSYGAFRLLIAGPPSVGVWFPEKTAGSFAGDAETTSVRLMFSDAFTSSNCFSNAMGALSITVAGIVDNDSDSYLYGDFEGLVCDTGTPVTTRTMKGQFSARLDVESQDF